MSTITTTPSMIRWPRAAIITVALLVVAWVTTVAFALSVAGRTTTRTVFRPTPAASQVYSSHWGHLL